MNIYVIVDMEGIATLVDPGFEASFKGRDYDSFRRVMSDEVAAVARGLHSGGAQRVIVSDFHGNGKNIIFSRLPEYVELVRGDFRPGSGRDGVDIEVDGLVFLGAHASSYTKGAVIAHTYSSDMDISVNGESMNEFSLLAAAWGERGVPPLLVSGDQAVCDQARSYLPGVLTVPTKVGLEFRAARCFHPGVIEKELEKQARAAIAAVTDARPLVISKERKYELSIRLPAQPWADRLAWIPGARPEGDRSYSFSLSSMDSALNIIYGVCMLRP